MTTSQQNVTLSLVGHPQDIKRLKAVPPSCDVCRWFLAVKPSKTVQPLHMLHPLPYFYSVKAVIYASMHAFVDRDFNEKYANISMVIGTRNLCSPCHMACAIPQLQAWQNIEILFSIPKSSTWKMTFLTGLLASDKIYARIKRKTACSTTSIGSL